MRRRVVIGCFVLLVLLAIGMRALGFEWVFVGGEDVVFAPGDAQYHVRRIFYAWSNFPAVLFSDPYINYPHGAAISWPPLFDFVVAGVVRLLTSSPVHFQVLAAWAPPVFGVLQLVPVFALGRRLGGRALGLGAAGLLALLPMSVTYSRVGQLDHHCAVALIGACLLYVVMRLVEGSGSRVALGAGLAAARIAILLTWHGSLLYLALVEGVLWTAAALSGRRELLGVQAASALATLAVVAPLVWLFPEPLGGPWSGIALSRLHVLAMTAVTLVSGGLWWLEGWLEGRAGERGPVPRLATTVGVGVAVVVGLALTPGIREGVEPALRFLTLSDGVGQRTGEQLPLFEMFGRTAGRPVTEVWGLLGYAIPLLPFGVLWAAPRDKRAEAWVLAAWCAWFGVLAVLQRRYGNDLGPAAALGFALAIATLAKRLSSVYGGRRWVTVGLQVAIPLFALAPALIGQSAPKLASGIFALSGGYAGQDRALSTVAGTLTRFMEQIREVTPETSGYLDVSQRPEYGIAAHPNFGHAIQNVARRPTPADPFWSFIGMDTWDTLFRLLGADSEDLAVEMARDLQARYVMTFSSAYPETVEGWLQHADGRAVGPWGAAEHFRLVTQGPAGGVHFAQVFQVQGLRLTGQGQMPYKLFEVVEGAVLEVAATPGDAVSASLRLHTPEGEDLSFEWTTTAGLDGLARLRVPYPTTQPHSLHEVAAAAPYRVSTTDREYAVRVTLEAVREGEVVRVQ